LVFLVSKLVDRTKYVQSRRQLLILGGLFLFSLALYAATMSRGITWLNTGQDGGDFISAARSLGVPHPTGYPTYTLLLRAFGDVVDIGSHAFRANLFSALTGALTVPFVYIAASRVIRSVPGSEVGGNRSVVASAVVAALAFATSQLFWMQNTITEVYSLNALFGAVLLVMVLGVLEELRARNLAIRNRVFLALLFGVGLGNHTTLGLAATPFGIWILWVVWQRYGWRGVFDWRPAVGLVVGLSVYVYAPIAASADPIVNWGASDTFEGFKWMASASIYQSYAFGIESEALAGRISKVAEMLFTQYTIVGTVIGITGLTTIWSYSREFVYVSLASIFAIAIYSVSYATPDSFIYLISAFMVFSLWLSVGIALLGTEVSRFALRIRRLASHQRGVQVGVFVLVILVLPVWSVASGWSEIDISGDNEPAEFAERSIARVAGGVILVEEPELFSLVYQSQVASPELDVMVVGPGLLQHEWYWDSLVKYYGDRMPDEMPDAFADRVSAVVAWNLGVVPVYATATDKYYYGQFNMVEDGDLFRIDY
jgi:hypothetical protein